MRILVTGSSGLIGSKLCEKLENLGHCMRRFDLKPPYESGVPEDLLDSQARNEAIRNVNGVIHLAAVSRVIDAELDPQRCALVNASGTSALLNDLTTLENPPWFIYGSSREVYGNPDRIPADETLEVKPVNIYGESKVEAERSVRSYFKLTGAQSIIFRFSNVYGSVNDHETRVIPAFIRCALTGRPIRMDGAGHTFDFTHVDDTTEAVVKAVSMIGVGSLEGCHTLNVCTGRGTTLIELANIIISNTRTSPAIVQGKPRTYDVPHFIGSSSGLHNLLGISCNISLEEGIPSLIEEFRNVSGINDGVTMSADNVEQFSGVTQEGSN